MGLFSSLFGRKQKDCNTNHAASFQKPENFSPDKSEDVSDATIMIPKAEKISLQQKSENIPQSKVENNKIDKPGDEIMDAISSAVQRKITKPAPSSAERERISMELVAEQAAEHDEKVKKAAVSEQLHTPETDSASLSNDEKAEKIADDIVDDNTKIFKDSVEDIEDDRTRIFKPSELSGILNSSPNVKDYQQSKSKPEKAEESEPEKENLQEEIKRAEPETPSFDSKEKEPEISSDIPDALPAETERIADVSAKTDIPESKYMQAEKSNTDTYTSNFSSPVKIISSDTARSKVSSDPSVIPVWGTRMENSSRYMSRPSMPSFDDECFRLTWKLKGTSKKHRLRVISECTKGQPVFIICDSNGENCIVITEDGEEIGRLSEQDTIVYHNMVAGTPHNMYIQKISSKEFQKIHVKILVIVRKKETANT